MEGRQGTRRIAVPVPDPDPVTVTDRNSVLDGKFRRPEAGTEVRYEEELGEKGPQATTVQIVNYPAAG